MCLLFGALPRTFFFVAGYGRAQLRAPHSQTQTTKTERVRRTKTFRHQPHGTAPVASNLLPRPAD